MSTNNMHGLAEQSSLDMMRTTMGNSFLFTCLTKKYTAGSSNGMGEKGVSYTSGQTVKVNSNNKPSLKRIIQYKLTEVQSRVFVGPWNWDINVKDQVVFNGATYSVVGIDSDDAYPISTEVTTILVNGS